MREDKWHGLFDLLTSLVLIRQLALWITYNSDASIPVLALVCCTIMLWSHLSRKAASYEPRIAILGIWGDTWLTRGKYGIYVAVRGSYGALTGSTDAFCHVKSALIYCRVSYVAVTRIPSLVLHNTWHYMTIRYSYGEPPKFVLLCSYESALHKGVTTALVWIPDHVEALPKTVELHDRLHKKKRITRQE